VSDENPPQAFNWNLGPKGSKDPAGKDEPADAQLPTGPETPVVPDPADPFGIFNPPNSPPVTPTSPPVTPYSPPPVEPRHEPPYIPPFLPPTGYVPVPAEYVPPPELTPPTAYTPPSAFTPPPELTPPSAYTPPPELTPPPVGYTPPQYHDTPTQAYSFDSSLSGAGEGPNSAGGPNAGGGLGAQPVGLPEPRDEAPPASALDALFGDTQFKEYEPGFLPSESPFVSSGGGIRGERIKGERQPLQRSQKVLLWVAGSLVAALALVGLFLVGTKLSGVFAQPAPIATPTPTSTTVAEPAPAKVGPLPPGTYAWADLLGTECLQPFTSAWDENFTVVDCATPHAAQLNFHGIFDDEAFAEYPGAEELQTRINLLCTSSKAINYAAASQFSDIEVSASYAASAKAWDAGERDYYCFVDRSTGDPLSTSVAVEPTPGVLTPSVPGNDP
jgi:hypothetical protein